MSQPRGRGGNPGRNNRPSNPGGNAWGNQSGSRPQSERPSNDQNQRWNQNQNQQPTPNFSDSDAFGPPLGGRARPNRAQEAQASTSRAPPQAPTARVQQPASRPLQTAPSRAPQATSSRGPQPSVNVPPPATTQGKPSAWGQPKQSADSVSVSKSGSTSKYKSDDKIRSEPVRGKIHGNRPEQGAEMVKTRPEHIQSKQGSSGMRHFMVKANYFMLNAPKNWQIFHYRVDFLPEIENAAFRSALLARQRPRIGSFLYDRGSSIFTVRELEAERFDITTVDERDNSPIVLKLKRVGLISAHEHQYLHILNLISKNAFKPLNLQLVGRDYFDPVACIDIRMHNIELWPGYTTSIRQHERSILMMTEIKHKLMRTETVLELLNRCYQENRTRYRESFLQQVLGMVVLTRYNNKTYRISDVIFDLTPESTFETRDGPISYIAYYQQKHSLRITDPRQPLLRSTPTQKDVRGARGRDEEAQPINLVPELCSPTGYTEDMRRNFNLMKDVAVHTRVGPAQRIQKLISFNNRLQTTEKSMEVLNSWALTLDRDLVTIPARQLDWEILQLGNNITVKAVNAAWANELQGRNSMYISAKLDKYEWVAVVPKALSRDAQAFIKCVLEVSNGMRFQVGEPEIVEVPDDRSTTLSNALETVCNKNKKLILITVSNNQADRYSIIKKVCTVRHAVPSQVVTRRVMDSRDMRRMRSVATKVAIQMNSKIGGLPWNIDVKMNNIMFIGYDVCHDTRDKSRSYGAIVATMDMRCSSKFYSAASAHTNGEELSNHLSLNVVQALHEYRATHGKLPDRILFYRDGVGEGQTNYVYEHELQHLLNTLKTSYKEQTVKLAFVIVSKRINTKFFEEKVKGRSENVPPGTVVDDIVTLPERYDFFLVSQAVNQGTATPTNYNVIYDTFGLPPDKLQMMTYKMCHLYYNWCGTTRVPAVCQYAHKLAFLVGNYLHQAPARELSPYLYFL